MDTAEGEPGNAVTKKQLAIVRGEIEAGLVFAAGAIEFARTSLARALTCRFDAEECYGRAVAIMRQLEIPADQLGGLEILMTQLRERLDVVRNVTLPPSEAA